MRTLQISISDLEYQKFGIRGEQLHFSELLDIISKEITKLNLQQAVELSEKYGLSEMSMEEISAEVKAVKNK
ncbi:hypothetical protein RCZ04_11120 [Capnocytophaga sp. HP1101]